MHACRIKCMYAETPGSMYAEFGCMSIERYAVVGCKVCGNSWVPVCGCWVQVYGAVGCMLDTRQLCLTVGSLPDSRQLDSPCVTAPNFDSLWPSLWSSSRVYGVLSLSMEFYLCLWSSIFVGNTIGNTIGNSIGNTIGNSISDTITKFECIYVCF